MSIYFVAYCGSLLRHKVTLAHRELDGVADSAVYEMKHLNHVRHLISSNLWSYISLRDETFRVSLRSVHLSDDLDQQLYERTKFPATWLPQLISTRPITFPASFTSTQPWSFPGEWLQKIVSGRGLGLDGRILMSRFLCSSGTFRYPCFAAVKKSLIEEHFHSYYTACCWHCRSGWSSLWSLPSLRLSSILSLSVGWYSSSSSFILSRTSCRFPLNPFYQIEFMMRHRYDHSGCSFCFCFDGINFTQQTSDDAGWRDSHKTQPSLQ